MGQIQIIDDFYSALDKHTRRLRIYLPDSYQENPEQRYPVIFMTDGQNVFAHPQSARYDTWCVNLSLDELYAEGALEREWLVCAIDHLPDRFAEYTPWYYPQAGVFDPQGSRFLNNLSEFIIPYVHRKYRTLKGPENTALIGSSLGGLMALYCGRERPDLIGRIGAVSPSVMWANFRSFRHWSHKDSGPAKIYLDTGQHEEFFVSGIQLDYASVTLAFYQHLRALGYNDAELKLVVDPHGQHSECDWARRFPDMVKYLLNDR